MSNYNNWSPFIPVYYAIDRVYFRFYYIMADILKSPIFNKKSCNIHSLTHQLPIIDNNNISLLNNRKSCILKLNRLICLIIRCGG